MRPIGPSSPSSTPSYKRCASAIVRFAEKRSLCAASCCKLLVMNGAGGFLRRSFFSTRGHDSQAPARELVRDRLRLALRLLGLLAVQLPDPRLERRRRAARHVDVDRPVLLRDERLDLLFALARRRRTATDCTRPADSPRCTLFHRIGLNLVADQPIEDAARLLRVVDVHVDRARRGDRGGDALLA